MIAVRARFKYGRHLPLDNFIIFASDNYEQITFEIKPSVSSHRFLKKQAFGSETIKMAGVIPIRKLRTTRKVENMCYVYFNKNCENGDLINEMLLPDKIGALNETMLFTSLIEHLIGANYDPAKFGKVLNNCVGDYTTKIVSSRLQLKKMLKEMCIAINACPNFIVGQAISKCPYCESDEDEDENGSATMVDGCADQTVIIIILFYYV